MEKALLSEAAVRHPMATQPGEATINSPLPLQEGATTSDSTRRLDQVEKKLDLILKSLEALGRPTSDK